MSRSPITEHDLAALCATLKVEGTTAMVVASSREHATIVHDEPSEQITSILADLSLPHETINSPSKDRSGRIKVWSDGR